MAQTVYNSLRTQGFNGQLADSSPNDVSSMRNDEASASMAFGHAIKFASASDESSAELLTANTETVAGIVLKQDSYAATQLDAVGVVAGNHLNIVRKGRVFVLCEDGCNVGDRLYIRAVATGGEIAGALLASAVGSDTIDSSAQGQWLTSAGAGELAWLDVDFSRLPA